MKLRKIILALIALSFLATLFAAEPLVVGSGKYGAEIIESLEGTGLIKLEGTSIERLHVTGSLIAQDAKIGTLDVMGEANLTGSTIKNNLFVMGSFQAVRSSFEKAITLHSHKAVFTASQIEAITVRKDSSFKGKQIIELKQGTIVNGPIHFESGKGEVLLFSGSQVLGSVTGGKTVKK